jgi:hypothetical protein
MFMTNARLFWTHMNKIEPETVTHLGDYPEDNPVNFAFELSAGEKHSYVVVQITDQGLVTRELDKEEIKFIIDGEPDVIESESKPESNGN